MSSSDNDVALLAEFDPNVMLICGEPTRVHAPRVSVTSGAIVLVEKELHELGRICPVSGVDEAVIAMELRSAGELGGFASVTSFTARLASCQVISVAAPKADTRNICYEAFTPMTAVTIVVPELEVFELALGGILVVIEKAIQAIVVLVIAVLGCFAIRVLGAVSFAPLPRPLGSPAIKTGAIDVLEIWTTPRTDAMRRDSACALVEEKLINRCTNRKVVVLGVVDEAVLVVVPLVRAVLGCLAPRGLRAVSCAGSQGVLEGA